MKTTLEEILSNLYRAYGTSGLFLKMTAADARPGEYVQLMPHPTRRMASYVLKVTKNWASVCLMLPATEMNDDCSMIEVEKIRVSKFSTDFVARVLTREYKHMTQKNVNAIAADFARTQPAYLNSTADSVMSFFTPKTA